MPGGPTSARAGSGRRGKGRMPKKGGKSAAPVDDEETIKRKTKRIKEIMESWLAEANIEPDTALVNKIYDSQGWPRNNGPDEPVMSNKLVFQGENREGSSGSDKISSVAVKQFGKAMKDMCPLHCNVKALCFWRLAVEDEGVKGIVEFAAKPPKPDVWEGLVNLELIECNLSHVACELLAERLRANIALRSLVLDFNPIGDAGVKHLAAGLRRNAKVSSLRLAYCGITSAAGPDIADGMIEGSKIKVLDLKGNRLGIHVPSSGHTVQGHALIPMFAALHNVVLETEDKLQAKALAKQREEARAAAAAVDEGGTAAEPAAPPAQPPGRPDQPKEFSLEYVLKFEHQVSVCLSVCFSPLLPPPTCPPPFSLPSLPASLPAPLPPSLPPTLHNN